MSKYGKLLPKNVRTNGQIYVALSRCGKPNNPNNIYIYIYMS